MSGETAGTANGSARDDLTRIAGLGDDIARRLDEAGIRTYAELADCSAGEIAKVLPGAPPLLWIYRRLVPRATAAPRWTGRGKATD
jgi:Helix-hairpin-helix domain